jgi:hypothetical protein
MEIYKIYRLGKRLIPSRVGMKSTHKVAFKSSLYEKQNRTVFDTTSDKGYEFYYVKKLKKRTY